MMKVLISHTATVSEQFCLLCEEQFVCKSLLVAENVVKVRASSEEV